MAIRSEYLIRGYREEEKKEQERAKKIRNDYFVNVQADKFNSAYSVHNFLIAARFYSTLSDDYIGINNKKYVHYDNNQLILLLFLNNDDEIFYIKGLREGTPKTAFDCLVALWFYGNDYAAALDIYRNPSKHNIYNQLAPYFNTVNPIQTLSDFIAPTFQPSAYGVAGWMTFDECLDKNLFSSKGIPLCVVVSSLDGRPYYLYYSDERHLITVAPNGTGKGTCVQIPVLLQYDAPMLVIDPKGENAAVTAKYRRDGMKHNVLILNPFNTLHEHFQSEGFKSEATNQFESACFNPLAALNPEEDHFVADVAALSEILVDRVGNDPYWSDSARELVTCLILFICKSTIDAEDKNLLHMRRLLTGDKEEFQTTMQTIADSEFAPMAQKARRFINDNKTNQSIISTAITQTSFLDDPTLAKNLVSNDIDFLKLKEGKMTVYVILPAKLISAYSKWFKLIVTSALNALMSTHQQGDKRVLVMLDECPILGRLSCIETAVGLARGYGIQIWSFWQDIHQLYDVYKERSESFLANAGVQQYFTPNDMTLAERLSNRLGNTTIFTRNATFNIPDINQQSLSHSETNAPFLNPTNLFSLPNDKQLLFFSGEEKAVLGNKIPYYKYDNLTKLASNNPYFKG